MYKKHFSSSYAEARQRFLDAAQRRHCTLESHRNPAGPGSQGEELAMDTAYIGDPDAPALLVMTSAMHGEEGYCGSGCQLALLDDDDLLAQAAAQGVGLLLVHAVNPYGFSYGQRSNENNIDLNRNFCDFAQEQPDNPHYRSLHPLLIPETWPPPASNAAAIQDFIDREGEQAYREGMMKGQHSHPDGLFYRGREPSWSNLTLRRVLRHQGAGRRRIGWVDYHTGLGPYGHAEKIFVQTESEAYRRARTWWGADVTSVYEAGSSTVEITGTALQAMLEECHAVPELTFMAMEYGTLPMSEVFLALRSDRWLARHPDVDPALRRSLKAAHRATFYPDADDWRGAVLGQSRVCILQAIRGLGAREIPR